MATIATHNGNGAHRMHNRRAKYTADPQEHIDPHGEHESWIDIDPRTAYKQLFASALNKYNNAPRRLESQKIADYYRHQKAHWKSDPEHYAPPVKEMILGVYEGDNESIPDDTVKSILHDYLDWFRATYSPQIEVIGAYWHADEVGAPHMHLDYIPISRHSKKGLSTQVSFNGALQELYLAQKINNIKYHKTRDGEDAEKKHKMPTKLTLVQAWTRDQNDKLETICREHGVTVRHPQRDAKQSEHLQTQLFKDAKRRAEAAEKEAKEAEKRRAEAEKELSAIQKRADAIADAVKEAVASVDVQKLQQDLAEAEKERDFWEQSYYALCDDLQVMDPDIARVLVPEEDRMDDNLPTPPTRGKSR